MHLLLWYSIYQIWGMVAFVNPLVLWLSFTDTEFIVITMMIHFVSPFWLTGVPPLSDPLFLLYILLSPPLFLTPSGFILPDPCPVSISPYSLHPPHSRSLSPPLSVSLRLWMGSGCWAGGAGGRCDGSAVWCRVRSGRTSRGEDDRSWAPPPHRGSPFTGN